MSFSDSKHKLEVDLENQKDRWTQKIQNRWVLMENFIKGKGHVKGPLGQARDHCISGNAGGGGAVQGVAASRRP